MIESSSSQPLTDLAVDMSADRDNRMRFGGGILADADTHLAVVTKTADRLVASQ